MGLYNQAEHSVTNCKTFYFSVGFYAFISSGLKFMSKHNMGYSMVAADLHALQVFNCCYFFVCIYYLYRVYG